VEEWTAWNIMEPAPVASMLAIWPTMAPIDTYVNNGARAAGK
jgi:hypothetical protein